MRRSSPLAYIVFYVEDRVLRYCQSPSTHANHEDMLSNVGSMRSAINDGPSYMVYFREYKPELAREQKVLNENDPHSHYSIRYLLARREGGLCRHLPATEDERRVHVKALAKPDQDEDKTDITTGGTLYTGADESLDSTKNKTQKIITKITKTTSNTARTGGSSKPIAHAVSPVLPPVDIPRPTGTHPRRRPNLPNGFSELSSSWEAPSTYSTIYIRRGHSSRPLL